MLGQALLATVEVTARGGIMALQNVEIRLNAVMGDGVGLEESVQVSPLRIQALVIFGFGTGDDPDESVDEV